ncbi:MAG: response regulator [Cyclobacteriaceae bacterium]|nr:response regulator [Cyclobacteriaceae bacterium]
MSKKVLIVDDSNYMRTLIKDTLKEEGYEIVGEAPNGETAIDLAMELKPDLMTLDNILPDMVGNDIIKIIKDEGLKTKVVVISAVGQQSVVNEGMEYGASDYIVKPFTPEDLVEVVNRLF